MSEFYQSLSHSKWDCKYHVVFVPKYRRKVMFGEIRKFLGPIFHELARQKECRIVEGHLMPDHVHMCIEIPPKYSVASIIGFLKGKSAIAIARQFKGKQRNFSGESFWARGYAVSTVGFELEAVKRYIQDQDVADRSGQFWSRVRYSRQGHPPLGRSYSSSHRLCRGCLTSDGAIDALAKISFIEPI
jgi:putative transposase